MMAVLKIFACRGNNMPQQYLVHRSASLAGIFQSKDPLVAYFGRHLD